MSALPWRRKAAGWAAVLVGLPLLTVLLVPHRDDVSLSTILVLYLALVVVLAAVGGLAVGLVAAVAAFLLENWFFTPPLHTLTVADAEHLVALTAFVAVSALVSLLVGRAVRRTREAVRARAEAEALARTTASLIGGADPLPAVVDQLRIGFGLDGVAVLERSDGRWTTLASSGLAGGAAAGGTTAGGGLAGAPTGRPHPHRPRRAWRSTWTRAATGGSCSPEGSSTRSTSTCCGPSPTSSAWRWSGASCKRTLRDAEALAETDALRRSLLQAVSHDLRTPLASIKAAVTSLLQRDVSWSAARPDELLGDDRHRDRPADRVVANLLDMSRLQSGALSLHCAPVALEDVVAAALGSVPDDAHRTTVDVPETVPLVEADPALLERAVANVVSNALAWSPDDQPVRIEAAPVQDRVCLRVIDRGPGIPLRAAGPHLRALPAPR